MFTKFGYYNFFSVNFNIYVLYLHHYSTVFNNSIFSPLEKKLWIAEF